MTHALLEFDRAWDGPYDERYFEERAKLDPDAKSNGGRAMALHALVPLAHPPEAIGLADYLATVEQFAKRYVAFPSEYEAPAVALWVAHAHLVEQFETSPPLAVTSAEMRSGKTRLLDVLELLVPNPFRVVTPEAVVYNVLAQRPRRTMLLDEADAIFGPGTAERYEGLRATPATARGRQSCA
jgi:hypothetical protein